MQTKMLNMKYSKQFTIKFNAIINLPFTHWSNDDPPTTIMFFIRDIMVCHGLY